MSESTPPMEQNPQSKESQEKSAFPDNIFVMVSHGTWEIPDYQAVADEQFGGQGAGELSEHFKRPDGLVAKDGSDYIVGKFGEHIAEQEPWSTTWPPSSGRMFVDANRPESVAKEIRKKTFGDVDIWKTPPSQEVQNEMVRRIWGSFQDRAQATAEMAMIESPPDEHALIVDIHDTDTMMINDKGEWVEQPLDDEGHIFPLLLVSDRDGKAAHPQVRKILAQQLLDQLVQHGLVDAEAAKLEGFKENFIYKGGFTTERYGLDLPNAYSLRGDEALKTKAQHMHFVQLELNRTMYVTEDRQNYDEEKLAKAQEAITEALTQTSELIRHLDLGNWREIPDQEGDEENQKAYERAMHLKIVAAVPEWYNRATPVVDKESPA